MQLVSRSNNPSFFGTRSRTDVTSTFTNLLMPSLFTVQRCPAMCLSQAATNIIADSHWGTHPQPGFNGESHG
jgi:hypothetical protein